MGQQPTDRARRCLAGGERLLTQVKAFDLDADGTGTKMGGATRVEVWETESFSGETRFTVMEFDAAGSALRSSVFDNAKAADSWLLHSWRNA